MKLRKNITFYSHVFEEFHLLVHYKWKNITLYPIFFFNIYPDLDSRIMLNDESIVHLVTLNFSPLSIINENHVCRIKEIPIG